MEANSLFGGRRKIVDKMTKTVCERLNNMSDEDIVSLEEDLLLRRGTINALRKKRQKVSMSLFDHFSCSLRLSLCEVFEPPQWASYAIRRNWEMHKRRNWFAKELSFPAKATFDIPLETYVTLKAAAEMRE